MKFLRRVSPEQWFVFRRLEKAGCAIDTSSYTPDYPLELVELSSHLDVPFFFPLEAGSGVVIGITFWALESLSISNLSVQADWCSEFVQPAALCSTHPNFFCFHDRTPQYPPLQIPKKHGVNQKDSLALNWKPMQPRTFFVAGRLSSAIPSTLPSLDLTIFLRTRSGQVYFFPIKFPIEHLMNRADACPQAPPGKSVTSMGGAGK